MHRATLTVAALAASSAAHAAVTITAESFGSTTPGLVDGTLSLQNGDFLILPNDLAPFTGDGIDEHTTWTFDLTADADYPSFPAAADGAVITDARLTLTLTQFFQPGPPTDLVRPFDLFPIIEIPLFLNAGETGTIDFDLLAAGYTSDVLLSFVEGNLGLFPMVYADDSIVSYARLDLTAIPTPGGAALLALSALVCVRRRR